MKQKSQGILESHDTHGAQLSNEILEHIDKSWNGLRFDFSPIVKRKPLKWPKKARVAFWVIPNIEHFVPDMPSTSLDPASAALKPDVLNYGWRDYALRVGFWRMAEVMNKYRIRGTAALNSSVCKYYPEVIKECKKLKWEFMGHGISNSWPMTNMDVQQQRAVVKEVVQTIRKSTGTSPKGWLGPALAETYDILDILAENGIEYVCDWCNDDQPYPMKVKSGTMMSIPYSVEINDITLFLRKAQTGKEFYEACVDQFDTLYREGKDSGRVMGIGLHSYLIGTPNRIKYLDKVFEYITNRDRVWLTTGSEIIQWCKDSYARD
jgi:allantoinase